ncbi:3 beta-hydroxysteroid dehydrogenase/Delta 5--_4-isomerase-like [Sceloporus undulatus]|uniref:3 beta-hydroxysteroid dehydrogenase/Delta 5-->4-isomerase-like n=1 Tax=Sceloporus undulatus TaxID=8520 RepID=UPI001C4CAF99|nr:3 beta-hydroxysteroid dehydrogenase/Delta 5-->4-isomerase-like [Sceloporus undulatus]XP_042308788.1 3 beta-hydroxysteroid dehydrogenase/Delta 5-->4-isomerase-like [Sceloporus undulatus]XP_042308790.1 3 beta-hydroxysteroid dehydrogenase/Delta 5-->4-isomerase-like [Sceloporus undulatus]
MALAGIRCLVTGAGGFLGRRIICQMLEEDQGPDEVRALDKAIGPETRRAFAKVKTKTLLTVIEGDIRDVASLQTAVQGITVVIHTACIIDTLGIVDKHTLWDVNVRGTQLLLESCLRNSVPYFIYTSSIEVTGPNSRGDPVYDGDEDTVYQSTQGFPYAENKKEAEKSVLEMDGLPLKDGSSFVTCALRSMYIYGEGSLFLQRHLDQSIQNNNIFLRISQKEALVNPAYVGNVAWAHVQAAKAMKDPEKVKRIRGQFYFISDDTPHVSYSDLNYELTKELGFGIQPKLAMPLMILYWYALLLEVVSFLLHPFVRYVPSINRHLVTLLNTPFSFSYRKAQRDFGYVPRYKWEEAKQQTSQWIAKITPLRTAYLKNKNS